MDPDELLREGVACTPGGRYDDAERWIRSALELDGGHPGARRELGRVLNFSGRFEEATEELRRALELAPDYREARIDLALVYTMLERNDEARGLLENFPGKP